jgi:hypothetical protein
MSSLSNRFGRGATSLDFGTPAPMISAQGKLHRPGDPIGRESIAEVLTMFKNRPSTTETGSTLDGRKRLSRTFRASVRFIS